ncbi:response regulator [Lactiplantibacillus songbeiensis]|uniref:Response regulator n=1 Tax=Lactiplantibacillus songbeiensis TaxID=2559920 RepID=A0ABW4C179_9LACO|nr:hypothetical protein [Lactiplantibacillus songbeiensis]
MLNVIICEDDPTILATHRLIVKNYVKEHPELAIHIALATAKPAEVETYLAYNTGQKNLYLLAISFPDSKTRGLKLATMIRKYDYHAQIIFISEQSGLKKRAARQAGAWLDFIDQTTDTANQQARLHQDLCCLTICYPPCERMARLTS